MKSDIVWIWIIIGKMLFEPNTHLKNTKVPFFRLISPKTSVNSAMMIAMSKAFGRLDRSAPALD